MSTDDGSIDSIEYEQKRPHEIEKVTDRLNVIMSVDEYSLQLRAVTDLS